MAMEFSILQMETFILVNGRAMIKMEQENSSLFKKVNYFSSTQEISEIRSILDLDAIAIRINTTLDTGRMINMMDKEKFIPLMENYSNQESSNKIN